MFDTSIHADSIYRITATAHPEEIRALLESALGGNFISSRKKLEDLMVLRGLSGEDVVGQVYRSLFDLDMPARKLVSIVDVLGEIDFRITEGADERIQLDALLAHLSIEGEE
jgi:replication factor C small subunit